MENLNYQNLTYEDLCQKLQDNEIGYLDFVKGDDETATLFANSMKLHGLPETDATAQGWLQHYEETSMKDDATAEEVLEKL